MTFWKKKGVFIHL